MKPMLVQEWMRTDVITINPELRVERVWELMERQRVRHLPVVENGKFAFWPLPPDALRPHVPSALSLDTLDGSAWIGVVPFRMSHATLRGLPALPWLSAFTELNVRTYVTVEDKPGVYFFSLDASNPVAVIVARWVY